MAALLFESVVEAFNLVKAEGQQNDARAALVNGAGVDAFWETEVANREVKVFLNGSAAVEGEISSPAAVPDLDDELLGVRKDRFAEKAIKCHWKQTGYADAEAAGNVMTLHQAVETKVVKMPAKWLEDVLQKMPVPGIKQEEAKLLAMRQQLFRQARPEDRVAFGNEMDPAAFFCVRILFSGTEKFVVLGNSDYVVALEVHFMEFQRQLHAIKRALGIRPKYSSWSQRQEIIKYKIDDNAVIEQMLAQLKQYWATTIQGEFPKAQDKHFKKSQLAREKSIDDRRGSVNKGTFASRLSRHQSLTRVGGQADIPAPTNNKKFLFRRSSVSLLQSKPADYENQQVVDWVNVAVYPLKQGDSDAVNRKRSALVKTVVETGIQGSQLIAMGDAILEQLGRRIVEDVSRQREGFRSVVDNKAEGASNTVTGLEGTSQCLQSELNAAIRKLDTHLRIQTLFLKEGHFGTSGGYFQDYLDMDASGADRRTLAAKVVRLREAQYALDAGEASEPDSSPGRFHAGIGRAVEANGAAWRSDRNEKVRTFSPEKVRSGNTERVSERPTPPAEKAPSTTSPAAAAAAVVAGVVKLTVSYQDVPKPAWVKPSANHPKVHGLNPFKRSSVAASGVTEPWGVHVLRQKLQEAGNLFNGGPVYDAVWPVLEGATEPRGKYCDINELIAINETRGRLRTLLADTLYLDVQASRKVIQIVSEFDPDDVEL